MHMHILWRGALLHDAPSLFSTVVWSSTYQTKKFWHWLLHVCVMISIIEGPTMHSNRSKCPILHSFHTCETIILSSLFGHRSSSPLSQLYGTQATLEHHHFNHAVIILNSEVGRLEWEAQIIMRVLMVISTLASRVTTSLAIWNQMIMEKWWTSWSMPSWLQTSQSTSSEHFKLHFFFPV